MKDFILSLIIVAILILLFSICYIPSNLQGLGSLPKYHGDSGVLIQGNGLEFVEMIVPDMQEDKESSNANQKSEEFNGENNENSENFYNEIIKKEQSNMNGMLIAFWHGVVTVLIGEVGALAVAALWKKICDDKKKSG